MLTLSKMFTHTHTHTHTHSLTTSIQISTNPFKVSTEKPAYSANKVVPACSCYINYSKHTQKNKIKHR